MGRAARQKHQRVHTASDSAVARWNAAAFGLATPIFIAAVAIVWACVQEPPSSAGQLIAAAFGLIVSAWLVWRMISARVTVTPAALDVRGVLRRRTWRWEDIEALDWERPLWMRLFFYRFGGGARVRVRLEDRTSFVPLALYGTIDYDRIDRVVGAGRRNLQLLGKRA